MASPPPDLLAIGHLTLDTTPAGVRPGGAAYYAALTAHRLGLRVAVLTSAGPDLPPAPLPPDIAVATLRAPRTTAFEHVRVDGARRLVLRARAADIEADDLPRGWERAGLVVLGPVCGEVDPALAGAFPEASVAALPQGWLRRREAGGQVVPRDWEDAGLVLPHAQVVVVSREDIEGREEQAVDWFQRVPVGAVTLGAAGALLYVNGERYHVEAAPARAVDDIGAGDVFATALLIEYHRTGDAWEAAAAAACAAAASVEAPGPAGLPDRAALAERLAAYRARRGG